MEEKKKNTGLTLFPSLHKRLKEQARSERRSVSGLCDMILDWALLEIQSNKINSDTLTKWKAGPPHTVLDEVSKITHLEKTIDSGHPSPAKKDSPKEAAKAHRRRAS